MRRFVLVTVTALLLGLGPPALHAASASAAAPAAVAETVIAAATTGAFDATLLDVPLQAGNCGVAVLIDDRGPDGSVGCTLLGVGGGRGGGRGRGVQRGRAQSEEQRGDRDEHEAAHRRFSLSAH